MKKVILLVLTLVCVSSLSGCIMPFGAGGGPGGGHMHGPGGGFGGGPSRG